MKRGVARAGALLAGAALLLLCAGCGRAAINYQVAESIGTLGKYPNNEPVETPRMKEAREQQEKLEADQARFKKQLEEAQKLADGYWYDEAVEYLEKIEKTELTQEEIEKAVMTYRQKANTLTAYEGSVPHLCFPQLIEDADRAFDGDDMSYTYSGTLLTVAEFQGILEQLYANDYILVDIYSVAREETDERGTTTMEYQELRLPEGKKPLILSQDNVNFSGVRAGDGIATKLVLDKEGAVKALYTDPEGHEVPGEYDFIPVLERFIQEHPDFSFRGARGIVTVSASEGIFGYSLKDNAVTDAEKNKETIKSIADALTKSGWHIGCAGYGHGYLNELGTDALRTEIEKWKEEAGVLVGEADILFYPYGAEVSSSDGLKYLVDSGFHYLCGLWGDTDFMEIGEGYLRQTRRFVDGYTLTNAGSYFTGLFEASAVTDAAR